MQEFTTGFHITEFLDKKGKSLLDCYNYPANYGYQNKKAFLDHIFMISFEIMDMEIPLESNHDFTLGGWNNGIIARFFKSLAGFNSDLNEINNLIFILADKLKDKRIIFDHNSLCDSLYGFKNMSSKCEEVNEVLNVICQKIINNQDNLLVLSFDLSLFDFRYDVVQAFFKKLLDSPDINSINKILLISKILKINNTSIFETYLLSKLNEIINSLNENEILDSTSIVEIFGFFQEKKTLTNEEIKLFNNLLVLLRDLHNQNKLSAKQISQIFKNLINLVLDSKSFQELIIILTRKIKDLNLNEQLNAEHISNIIASLKYRDLSLQAVQSLFARLSKKIKALKKEDTFSGEQISEIFISFQGLDLSLSTNKELVIELINRILKTNIKMSIEQISKTMSGFKSSVINDRHYLFFIDWLTNRLNEQPNSEQVNFNLLSNIIYSLKNSQNDTVIMRNLIIVTSHKIKISQIGLNWTSISKAFYGLCNMTPSTPDVLFLINRLRGKIKQLQNIPTLDGADLSILCYGLKNIVLYNDEIKDEVFNLLNQLTEIISQQKYLNFTSNQFGMIFYGMQNLDITDQNVRNFISAIESKISNSNKMIFGMQESYQFFAGYLCLHNNRNRPQVFLGLLSKLLQITECKNLNLLQVKTLYITSMKAKHQVDNKLDLHGLDHLSANFLLHSYSLDLLPAIVIYGKSSHSKSSNLDKMKNVVLNYLENNNADLKEYFVEDGYIKKKNTSFRDQ